VILHGRFSLSGDYELIACCVYKRWYEGLYIYLDSRWRSGFEAWGFGLGLGMRTHNLRFLNWDFRVLLILMDFTILNAAALIL
jgi:hypothetical protein